MSTPRTNTLPSPRDLPGRASQRDRRPLLLSPHNPSGKTEDSMPIICSPPGVRSIGPVRWAQKVA